MEQKRVTCKGKVDDSTEHFKTLNLLSQTPSASCALATNHLQPLGRDWDLVYQSTAIPEECFAADSIFAEHTHSKEDFTKVYRIVETLKVHNE